MLHVKQVKQMIQVKQIASKARFKKPTNEGPSLASRGSQVRSVPVGIMVETPAAAVTLDRFKGLIDFASIGTNDLVQ
jgi:phosphoenolpyruvate-protein kinase (PTS system EI component)